MPPVNAQQFWKANPNQMALPGMEEHSHPAAAHLAQGYHVSAWEDELGMTHLQMRKSDTAGASLEYDTKTMPNRQRPSGEIAMVQTALDERGQGLATALFGVGRTMARLKPQHSTDRTRAGDLWAPKASAVHGGRVPKSARQRYLERRGEPIDSSHNSAWAEG